MGVFRVGETKASSVAVGTGAVVGAGEGVGDGDIGCGEGGVRPNQNASPSSRARRANKSSRFFVLMMNILPLQLQPSDF